MIRICPTLMVFIFAVSTGYAQHTAVEDRAIKAFDVQAEVNRISRFILSESRLDSIVNKALANSYEIKMAETLVDQDLEQLKISQKNWSNALTVGVNLFGYNITPSSVDPSATLTEVAVLNNAAVTLLISPYNLLTMNNRTKTVKKRLEMDYHALENTRRKVKMAITNKFLDYQKSLEAYILAENSVMLADEVKHLSDEFFKQGRLSPQEYNEVLQTVSANQRALLDAETTVMKYKLELEYLIGEK